MKVIDLKRVSQHVWASAVQCEMCGQPFVIYQGVGVASCPACGFRELLVVRTVDNQIQEETYEEDYE